MKGKRPLRGFKPRKPSFDWDSIGSEYVTGTMSIADLAQKHGVSERQAFEMAGRQRWGARREEHRAEASKRAETAALEKSVKFMVEAVGQIHALKLLALQKVLKRLQDPKHEVTLRDLDLLQRLEMDVIGASGPRDGGERNVTINNNNTNLVSVQSAQSVIDEIRKVRGQAHQQLMNASDVADAGRMDDNSAAFMYGAKQPTKLIDVPHRGTDDDAAS